MFGILGGLGSDISWGVGDFLAAVSSRKIGNLLTFFWMQAIGLTIALFYLLTQLNQINFSTLVDYLPRLVIIAFLQLIAYIYFYRGLEKAQVSLVSALGACWGLVTAILSVIFYHEVLKATQVLAIIIILSGILLVSTDWKNLLQSKKASLLNGVKEGVIAMLGWGISLFLIVPPSRTLGWFLPTFSFRIITLFLLFAYLLWNKREIYFPTKNSVRLPLVFVGIMDIAGHFSYNFGVSTEQAAIVAPVASAYPFVTVLLALIVLKEKLQKIQGVGIGAIIGGLILIAL